MGRRGLSIMGLRPPPHTQASADQLLLLMNLDFNKNNDSNYGNKTKTKAGNIYQSCILCTKHYSKSVSNTYILTITFLFFFKNYYLIVIFFFFLPYCAACGVSVHQWGSNPRPLLGKHGVLTTGPPGKSQPFFSFSLSYR